MKRLEIYIILLIVIFCFSSVGCDDEKEIDTNTIHTHPTQTYTPTTTPLLTSPPSPYEPPEIEWEKTFGGSYLDYANSVHQTTDNGYIIAGETESLGTGPGSGDILLLKYQEGGRLQWGKTYDGAGREGADCVQETQDGGYIIAASTRAAKAMADALIIKVNSSGEEEWRRIFGSSLDDFARSVQQTSDGGFVFAGETESYGAGGDDAWLVKVDDCGNEEWSRTFGDLADDWAVCVHQTSDDGYIIAGATYPGVEGMGNIWLIKTDSEGKHEWVKLYRGESTSWASCVQQTSDGGYVMAGCTQVRGLGDMDFLLLRTDHTGSELWQRTFGGLGWDRAYSVRQTVDGGYILAGATTSFGAGKSDLWLLKTNSKGEIQWHRTLGGPENDASGGCHVEQTFDGGYIAVCKTVSYGAGRGDVWILKLK